MMKTLIKILFLLTFLISINAQQGQLVLKQANEAYQNKNYEEALSLYKSLVDEGFAGGELFYNLGNTYFKTDQLGYAILYYEKALKYNPGDEDIEHNLAIANARTVDKVKEVPQLFLVEWFNYYLAIFPVSVWSYIMYLFYLVFILSIGFFFLSRKLRVKRLSLYITSISFILTIIFSVTLFAKVNQESSSNFGVLISRNESAKNSPDAGSNDAFIINEGAKFAIEDTVNNWGKIRLADGKVGWLPKSSYEKI